MHYNPVQFFLNTDKAQKKSKKKKKKEQNTTGMFLDFGEM